MSHGTKYRLTYSDRFSQAVQIDIMKNGYTGAINEIKGAGEPLLINHETASDFLFDPILGTFVTLRLFEETADQFSDLFTLDGREWKVIVFIAGFAYFKGFILPNYYQSPYKHVPYHVEVIAADQLGLLRNYDYDYYQSFEIKRPIDMLATILNKTNLELDIIEGVNIYEDGMDQTVADSPLDQCWIDQENYADSDGKPLNCYTVLKDLLLKFTAVIRQVNGKWHIWRPSEAGASYTRRTWEWDAGVYSYSINASYNPIVSTTSASTAMNLIVRVMNEGTLFLQSGYKDYKLIQDYGLKQFILRNSDFTEWIDPTTPENWSKEGGIIVYQWGDSKIRIDSWTSAIKSIYQSVNNIAPDSNKAIKIFGEYTTFGPAGSGGGTFVLEIKAVKISDSTVRYYDFETESWSSNVKRLAIGFNEGHSSESFNIKTTFLNPVGTNFDLIISIYNPVCSNTNAYIIVDKVDFLFQQVTLSEANDYEDVSETEISVNANNNLNGETIEILTADLPNYYWGSAIQNVNMIYGGGIYLDENRTILTALWQESGREPAPLLDYFKEKMGLQYNASQEMLSVNILTKLLSGDSTIREINDNNKKFHINRATWSQKSGIWQCELTEIKCEQGFLITEDGDYIVTELGEKIIIT